ncbi:ABC transporter A family member 1 isoform X2 [Amborella trichopoda]|uniref:ABC transporter A family member 1 isoform X2 n=1 Tax=Amborella trichopoda TaxID=13333 RepID=UPI0009BE78C7|nr:ABC transporter A family member 1 isoform X2 [Amborella trichopoda]|eukprot:XP_020526672.1 ABC transporter A family member 1 isoform X2 [Amborella trichopoda]
MGGSTRQLKAMLRKNWLLKIRHPFVTAAEVLLPTVVMLMLIGVRTRVDTQMHPAQAYIRKGMFVEVGGNDISPSFDVLLKLWFAKDEHLAFAPDTSQTRLMLNVLALRFPLLKMVGRIYKDEAELETYLRSDDYGVHDPIRNCSYPMIKAAIIFHELGPLVFDYSIRLNHTWAFSGFPDVKSIMDTNGPYLYDLQLGVDTVPTLQYGFSGFLTLQQVVDSFIISSAQRSSADLFHDGAIIGGLSLSGKPPTSKIADKDTEYPDISGDRVFQDEKHRWKPFQLSRTRIVPFPTREYTDDEFQTIIKKVMGVLYLLGFLYPISRLISYSVFEKEHRIKEGLYMMGLKDEIFYLSWFITYTIQFAASAAIITLCTMTSLFQYSDKTVVFIYFYLFGLSAIMLSFLISTFFSRAKTAVAVGTLSFLGGFFPYYMVNDPAVPMVLKVLASFFSPTAFALGTINFADYERAHVGVRWSNIWEDSSGVNFLMCLLMMMLDTILYCVIGLYLDKVLPREHGVRYPWYFLFSRDFWQKSKSNQHHSHLDAEVNMEHKRRAATLGIGKFSPVVEPISLDMKNLELDGRCIQIRDLHKVFISTKGKCCAVNSLQLTLYENQILALLGHNGAGKSTTISMLVGLLPPTSGDALVFGKSTRTDMDVIRKQLGVCPQHDILFTELTVKEHLEIYAILKGVSGDTSESEISGILNEIGLVDKAHTIVSALSGGMKRKLSLGLALLGNSKVIILDEPTSGMDPYSMRSTWQLIKRMKKGRIILLTTHSMDEADVLGDRIAIMANGSLKCCGSSLFLKHHYGVGYTLTLSTPGPSAAADIVLRHVPSATYLSDVGTEISFRLPLTSSSSFETMFLELERCITKPEIIPRRNTSEGEHSVGIESFGISVTTLEEVFLRVTGCDFDGFGLVEPNPNQYGENIVATEGIPWSTMSEGPNSEDCIGTCGNDHLKTCFSINRACGLILSTFISVLMLLKHHCCCSWSVINPIFKEHFKALLVKRSICARRDKKTVCFQLLIPALFLFFGLLFLKLKPHPDQQSVTLTTSYFNPLLTGGGGGGPIPFNLTHAISRKVAAYMKGGWIQRLKPRSYKFPNPEKALHDAVEAAGPVLGPALLSMSEFLITSLNESYQSRYGAILMDDLNDYGDMGYTVLHNCSCQHAAPTYINLMNNAILRFATGNKRMEIRTRNHPLPMSKSQHSQHQDLDAFSAAIIVSIAFSFIPASFAVPIVKEREVKAKHQQLLSGVSILAYWISTFVWDFISFLFPMSLAIVLFYIFGLHQFVGTMGILPTTLMFLAYGSAIPSSTYCLTFFFSDHTIAQNVILLVHFLSGLILMVISFIMGLVKATKSTNSLLKNFFRISPGFCLADGLASLALRRQGMKSESGEGTFDWNVTGASICYLGLESVLYFVCTIGLEYFSSHQLSFCTIKGWWTKGPKAFSHIFTFKSISEPLIESLLGSHASGSSEEDADVQAERFRVYSGAAENSIIYLRDLHKVYHGGRLNTYKVAVHSLTFSVRAGECFGFLGPNGAGKTTTLSIISGEEHPTEGTAYIFGNDIRLHPKAARRHVGYCPQFDPLIDFLSVREHLELYARLKGVPIDITNRVVMEKLKEFNLLKHADKISSSLSGGNKRKLSVAMAMIGDPPIVILDEPSTGMDPLAKRFMWDVISHLSTRQGKTAVILTTHSMSEAQALCTRIGIMVGGRLRCIGSPQHLKTRFGNYLELEVKPSEVCSSELDNLCHRIQEALFDFPCHPRGILSDFEICIGGSDSISSADVSEISLSQEMVISIGHLLSNELRVQKLLLNTSLANGAFCEQLSEQLTRDGGIPLRIFAEWWLADEKFSAINSFILSSFHGATFQGCNGLSVKYQLPYREGSSLADLFGHIERNRYKLGIAEYSISQSTLESIFNHFAANPL